MNQIKITLEGEGLLSKFKRDAFILGFDFPRDLVRMRDRNGGQFFHHMRNGRPLQWESSSHCMLITAKDLVLLKKLQEIYRRKQ